jgi:hypothetical protein
MIMDERTEFADATSVGTPNNTTVNVGSTIDSSVARDLGDGQPIYLIIQVTTTLVGAGSSIVEFMLSSDGEDALAVNGGQTIHLRSDYIAVDSLVAGWQMSWVLPAGTTLATTGYELYLGVQIRETAGTALSAGNINAFLSLTPATQARTYADAAN